MTDRPFTRHGRRAACFRRWRIAGRPARRRRVRGLRAIPTTRLWSRPGACRPMRSARAMARSRVSRVPERLKLDDVMRNGARAGALVAAAAAIAAFMIGGGRRLDGARRVRARRRRLSNCSPTRRSPRTGSISAKCAIRSRCARREAHLLPWLSRRLGTPCARPISRHSICDCSADGCLPGVHGPAALFMYESASGERFTLYCSRLCRAAHGLALQRQTSNSPPCTGSKAVTAMW